MALPPNVETYLPQLLADYAHSRRADLSLPDATALPFRVGPSMDEQLFPRVLFTTAATSAPHPKRARLTIAAELQTGSEAQDIPDENAWTAGLRHILSDAAAFQTWLQGQTAGVRAGFRITKYYLSQDPMQMGLDDKGAVRARRTDIMVHLRADELAP